MMICFKINLFINNGILIYILIILSYYFINLIKKNKLNQRITYYYY